LPKAVVTTGSTPKLENLKKTISKYDVNASRRYAPSLLLMYKRRLSMHLEAGFSPEISESYLFVYIRPQELLLHIAHINWLTQDQTKVVNLSIFCYELPSTIAVCNITLSILLSKDGTFKLIRHITAPTLWTLSEPSYTFLNTQKYNDTMKIRVPLRVTTEKSYRFTYQIHDVLTHIPNTESKLLRWSSWPLTSDCVQRYLQQLILDPDKVEFDDVLEKSCSTSTFLVAVSPHQAFEMERSTISSWLDVQYQASSSDMFDAVKPRNKHAFETVSNYSVCPLKFQNWILDYRHWHAKISREISKSYDNFSVLRKRILKENVRFMVTVHFDSGVADRFVHIISIYLVAVLTRRFFVFGDGWSDLHNVMRLSLASEQENVAPWLSNITLINTDLSLNHADYISQRLVVFRTERIFKEFNYDKSFPERILLFKSHIGNVIHTLTSPTSVYRQFLQSNLELTPANIYGCLFHSLMVPQLSTLLRITLLPVRTIIHNTNIIYQPQELLQLFLSSRYYPVGVQIRIGDHSMSEKFNVSVLSPHWSNSIFLFDFGGYFSCAHYLFLTFVSNETKQVPFVYLISDSHLVR
jgi:hypothetical protein